MSQELKTRIKKYISPEIKKTLNSWEQKFISSISKSKKELSEKQEKVFNSIIEKYNLIERPIEKPVERKTKILPLGFAEGAKINQDITSRNFRKQRFLKNKNK